MCSNRRGVFTARELAQHQPTQFRYSQSRRDTRPCRPDLVQSAGRSKSAVKLHLDRLIRFCKTRGRDRHRDAPRNGQDMRRNSPHQVLCADGDARKKCFAHCCLAYTSYIGLLAFGELVLSKTVEFDKYDGARKRPLMNNWPRNIKPQRHLSIFQHSNSSVSVMGN